MSRTVTLVQGFDPRRGAFFKEVTATQDGKPYAVQREFTVEQFQKADAKFWVAQDREMVIELEAKMASGMQ